MKPLLPPLLRHSAIWGFLWVLWASWLWTLSAGPPPVDGESVSIPFLDKILHFGYFFGGAGLLSACLWLGLKRRWKGSAPTETKWYPTVIFMQSAIAVLDEWHQSWNPERSGNSPGDLAADILGSLFGIWVFSRLRARAFGSPANTSAPEAQ